MSKSLYLYQHSVADVGLGVVGVRPPAALRLDVGDEHQLGPAHHALPLRTPEDKPGRRGRVREEGKKKGKKGGGERERGREREEINRVKVLGYGGASTAVRMGCWAVGTRVGGGVYGLRSTVYGRGVARHAGSPSPSFGARVQAMQEFLAPGNRSVVPHRRWQWWRPVHPSGVSGRGGRCRGRGLEVGRRACARRPRSSEWQGSERGGGA